MSAGMSRWLLLALAAGCGGTQTIGTMGRGDGEVAAADGRGAGEGLLTRGVEAYEIDGLRVLHKPTPGNPVVELHVFIDGGVHRATSPDGAQQLAIDVASFGGPASMTRAEFSAALDAMGASIGGAAGYDYARLSASAIGTFADETWSLFAQVLRAPAMRDADVALRREQALAGLRTERDDPDRLLSVLGREVAFAGHPYAVRPQGRVETVEPLDSASLVAAFEELRVRDAATLVVVGNVERSAVEAFVADAFEGWRRAPSEPPVVPALAYDSTNVRMEAREGVPTNYVVGYFAAPAVHHIDYPALQVAVSVLNDRLFEEVRTKRNLTYAVAAGLTNRRAPTGYLYVTATDPNTTIDVMLATVASLRSPGVTAQDLHDQIEGYLTQWYKSLETNSAQAQLLGDWALVGGGHTLADQYAERLRQVTPDDVARVVDTYIRDLRYVVVGDPAAVDTSRFEAR